MDIYCDGSCIDNGKESARGGWAFIVTEDNKNLVLEEHFGKLRVGKQTNNMAELEALLQVLRWIDSQSDDKTFTIYCDSEILVKCVNGRSMRSAHREFWTEIEALFAKNLHKIRAVEHIEAHCVGSENYRHWLNNKTDKLAKQAANSLLIKQPVEPVKSEEVI